MEPNKFKMSIKIWLAIYPSITFFLFAFGEAMASLSLPIKTMIMTMVLVPWVVYIGVPVVDSVQQLLFKNEGK